MQTVKAPTAPSYGSRALDAALAQFDAAADHMALEPGLSAVLRVAQRGFTIHFPVHEMTVRSKSSWATASSTTWREPAESGSDSTPEPISTNALAIWMTWKAALVDVPFGGATGGVTWG